MYGVLSQIEAELSLKNAWLPPIFFLDTKSTYKTSKNIPVLVSIGDRKSEYLEMRRTIRLVTFTALELFFVLMIPIYCNLCTS